ncbi:MAG: hypothetical protein A2Y82_02535 [Candidatus Buchananbacteria bacterium RBG_13_36_9]|uniref:Branched-chain amino acid ABC transporter permease n=1 Tax=Candidatus Buchananbacteria bacterium RBG_13_36_9 TaxID=1797530 RepID=A0A1G1XNP2_9BACT|nr:MAG: hypothetical protein A2Y82_02535 [Candidatus Buchananbacteria bacterium RBG_13_36_9]
MAIFLQLFINGVIAGSIYALVASGFSLIYSTNRFIHFAHGTMVTVSAYFLYWLFAMLGLNFYLAGILTIIFAGFLGWLSYIGFYKQLKMKKASNAVLLVASIGLLILMENLMLLIFGADVKSLNFIAINKGHEIGGAIITGLQIIIVVSALVLLALLFIFVKYAKLGKTMRAVADNPSLANILGINSDKICSYSFIIGSAIAGFAAILIALEQNIEPVMGLTLIIKGFTSAIIGGVTSLPGSILGSYLLGLAENFGIWYLPSGYKDAIAFVLLFLFLLIKPAGILGIRKGVKE